MIEADRADYNRAKLDHDLIVAITILERYSRSLPDRRSRRSPTNCFFLPCEVFHSF